MDGRPFKDGYKRFRIKTVTGIDDFRCIAEVVFRRYREAGHGNELFPDELKVINAQDILALPAKRGKKKP
jgi:excinuclease ABC subunit C